MVYDIWCYVSAESGFVVRNSVITLPLNRFVVNVATCTTTDIHHTISSAKLAYFGKLNYTQRWKNDDRYTIPLALAQSIQSN